MIGGTDPIAQYGTLAATGVVFALLRYATREERKAQRRASEDKDAEIAYLQVQLASARAELERLRKLPS